MYKYIKFQPLKGLNGFCDFYKTCSIHIYTILYEKCENRSVYIFIYTNPSVTVKNPSKPFSDALFTYGNRHDRYPIHTDLCYNLGMNKLTDELIDRLAAEIEDGLPVSYTCDLLGVYRPVFFNWIQHGEDDIKAGETETQWAKLYATIKKAYATFVLNAKRRIHDGKPGWQGTAWWLERTNKDFMPKQQVQADDEGKVQVIIGGKQKDIKIKKIRDEGDKPEE